MAKVGKGTVNKGPISTVMKDCVVPSIKQAGSWASTTNGENVAGGAKGTGGVITEVTHVDVGPAAGTKITGKGRVSNR